MLPKLADKERRVRLHITAQDSPKQKNAAFDESQAVEFPVAAKAALEAMIRSQVLTRMASFPDSHPIADALAIEVTRMEEMAQNWPKGETRTALHFALGNAYLTIGTQKGDAAILQKAVTAHREALKELTQERVPLDWAGTQNNLGTALEALGERSSDTEQLAAAVAAYREALKEYTQERTPLDWAETQNNLGAALQTLGERSSDTAQLTEAVAAYREALKEYTQERTPLDWAETQNNLDAALKTLGERDFSAKGLQHLQDAEHACQNALFVFESAQASYYVQLTQQNLARVQVLITNRSKPS